MVALRPEHRVDDGAGLFSDAHGSPSVQIGPPLQYSPPRPKVANFLQLGERTGLLRDDEAIWRGDQAEMEQDVARKTEIIDQLQRQRERKAALLDAMTGDGMPSHFSLSQE